MAGGQGGGDDYGNPGGLGGTGDTGQTGGSAASNQVNPGHNRAGGGGGGAGDVSTNGGNGGAGGGSGGGAGGSGGTALSPNGGNGFAGTGAYGGGGGGGGGFDGYYGSGLTQLPSSSFTFTGGNGGAGGATSRGGGGGGGAGGYGAVATGGNVNNAATVTGGNGGASGNGDYPSHGGDGGVGLAITANGATAANSGAVTGGGGGASASYAGAGGAGVALASGASLNNTGPIAGGIGGNATRGLGGYTSGNGGAGVIANGGTVTNNATISGGSGGAYTNRGEATGGTGGAGIVAAGGSVNNNGTILGGAGGQGQHAGLGGVGVSFTGSSGSLTNSGTIDAGAAGANGYPPANGVAGVSGSGLTVVDTGRIQGGAGNAGYRGGASGAQGDAIAFTGGNNMIAFGTGAGLAVSAGASGSVGLVGALDIKSGTLTFFQDAGSGLPRSIEVSDPIVGAGAVIQNTAGGTLTLSGVNTYAGGTTVKVGTLAVAADDNLGASAGGISLSDQGTLETTASFSTARGVTLAGTGTVQVDSGVTTTLTGVVSGKVPQFFKTGAGTLVLSNANNSYQSNTTIEAGNLSISADADLGNTSGRIDLEGGTLETTATLTSARAIQLQSSSTVQVDAGTTTLTGEINGGSTTELTKTGAGTLVLSGGSSFNGTTIEAGTLDLAANRSGGYTFTFAGSQSSPATLALETAAQPVAGQTFNYGLASFAFGDALDLKGLTYTDTGSSTQESYTITGTSGSGSTETTSGTLAVTENGETEFFKLSGIKPNQAFYAENDGNGGTLVYAPICFAAGTPIRAVRDGIVCDVPVEELAAGDLVVTAAGEHRPVRWMGHRTVDCLAHPDPQAAIPVRVAAGAFGPERPSRDIYLSPQHGVAVDCLGEVLIPVKHLINGGTIARAPRPRITYWHIELDSHDIVLAANLPCESFLDTQGRVGFFDNGADYLADHPDTQLASMDDFCRPLVQDGPLVAALRLQLQRRMEAQGWTLTHDADLHLMVDGLRIAPDVTGGDTLRFTVPAGAQQVRIASRSFVPQEVDAASGDGRTLGVPLKAIALADGLAMTRTVAIDDDCLVEGLNDVQTAGDARWRWTNGNAALPASLWDGCPVSFFLTVTLASERGRYRGWARPEPATAIDRAGDQSTVVLLRAAR